MGAYQTPDGSRGENRYTPENIHNESKYWPTMVAAE